MARVTFAHDVDFGTVASAVAAWDYSDPRTRHAYGTTRTVLPERQIDDKTVRAPHVPMAT